MKESDRAFTRELYSVSFLFYYLLNYIFRRKWWIFTALYRQQLLNYRSGPAFTKHFNLPLGGLLNVTKSSSLRVLTSNLFTRLLRATFTKELGEILLKRKGGADPVAMDDVMFHEAVIGCLWSWAVLGLHQWIQHRGTIGGVCQIIQIKILK